MQTMVTVMLVVAIAAGLGSTVLFVFAGGQLALAIYAVACGVISAALSWLHHSMGSGFVTLAIIVSFTILSTQGVETVTGIPDVKYLASTAVGLACIAGLGFAGAIIGPKPPAP